MERKGRLSVLCLAAVLVLTGCFGRAHQLPNALPSHSAGYENETGTSPAISPEPSPLPSPSATPSLVADDELVSVLDYIPGILVDLKCSTEDNFTGSVIYDFTVPLLRYGTVKKLAEVQKALLDEGLTLKVWDAYRPVEAQFRLWELCPDPLYVSNPNTGFSSHSRGNTVDVTLAALDGTDPEMPTGFDDFSPLADRDYSDASPEERENALKLENAMTTHGFTGYAGEWWHFSDSDSYPVIE